MLSVWDAARGGGPRAPAVAGRGMRDCRGRVSAFVEARGSVLSRRHASVPVRTRGGGGRIRPALSRQARGLQGRGSEPHCTGHRSPHGGPSSSSAFVSAGEDRLTGGGAAPHCTAHPSPRRGRSAPSALRAPRGGVRGGAGTCTDAITAAMRAVFEHQPPTASAGARPRVLLEHDLGGLLVFGSRTLLVRWSAREPTGPTVSMGACCAAQGAGSP